MIRPTIRCSRRRRRRNLQSLGKKGEREIMRITILILCCMFLVSCGKSPQPLLPDHKFGPSSRPGRAKFQIRAIVKLGSLTEADFRRTAVDLCKKYESRAAGSFLVQFFSDASCLEQWDGTGLLRDSDWPHWLCRITVETDTSWKLYPRTFKLAVDENTGQERTDVLKK